jgi:hypothetical protein
MTRPIATRDVMTDLVRGAAGTDHTLGSRRVRATARTIPPSPAPSA